MTRHNHHDLLAFLTVAKERSFARAAAKIGVSQSALSHTIRSLEERLGLRLTKRMGRPPGEPSKVVRLPLPVAALAKRLAEKSLRAGDINAFFDIEARRPATVPLMATSAACGFPSPAIRLDREGRRELVSMGPGARREIDWNREATVI